MVENPISKIFNDISDEELRQGITEMQEDDKTGFTRDGVVRKYAHETMNITSENFSSVLLMTQINLLRQAAYRWIR